LAGLDYTGVGLTELIGWATMMQCNRAITDLRIDLFATDANGVQFHGRNSSGRLIV